MMTGNQLSTQVTIQTRTVSVAADGSWTEAWTSGATIWARVEEGEGVEVAIGGRIDARQSATLTVRYTTAVNVRDRVTIGTVNWNVVGVSQDTRRHKWTTLRVEAAP